MRFRWADLISLLGFILGSHTAIAADGAWHFSMDIQGSPGAVVDLQATLSGDSLSGEVTQNGKKGAIRFQKTNGVWSGNWAGNPITISQPQSDGDLGMQLTFDVTQNNTDLPLSVFFTSSSTGTQVFASDFSEDLYLNADGTIKRLGWGELPGADIFFEMDRQTSGHFENQEDPFASYILDSTGALEPDLVSKREPGLFILLSGFGPILPVL